MRKSRLEAMLAPNLLLCNALPSMPAQSFEILSQFGTHNCLAQQIGKDQVIVEALLDCHTPLALTSDYVRLYLLRQT